MYVPRQFKVEDQAQTLDYIKANGFGTLVSQSEGRLCASHVPFHLHEKDGHNYLTCHIAKANHQKEHLQNDEEVLAIFMNTHGYISSSWYDHVNVPTWNYIAVHVYGPVRLMQGEELMEALHQMVDHYESSRQDRFYIDHMDEKMLAAHVNGLIGYEIRIDRIEATHKLSQNRKDHDYKNVVDQLEKEPLIESQELAKVMRQKRESLFS